MIPLTLLFLSPPDENVFHKSLEHYNNVILNYVTQYRPSPHGNICRLLSNNAAHSLAKLPTDYTTPLLANNVSENCITVNGIQYISISNLNIMYCHSHALTNEDPLNERGANGGLCDTDVHIIEKNGRSIDIQGIDDHKITDIPITTARAFVHTQRRPLIVILHIYAYIGHVKIIHSSGQPESINCDVSIKYIKVPGRLQRITIQKLLPYLWIFSMDFYMPTSFIILIKNRSLCHIVSLP